MTMLTVSHPKFRILGLAAAPLFLLQACSNDKPAQNSSGDIAPVRPALNDAAKASPDGFAPGSSLAFEWSANGFETLPAEYKWMGTGKRDDVYQPNFSLSVPETDDIVWSSSCAAGTKLSGKLGGRVETQIYMTPPKNAKSGRIAIRFETDSSKRTLQYQAGYSASGQFDGFTLVQPANDPMFADMKTGRWAYIQIGEGSDANKLRISLANAAKSLNAFLPACAAATKKAATAAAAPPAGASVAVRYQCEDGSKASATYLGNDTDTPIVRLKIRDQILLLPQAVSGSGALYENSQPAANGKKQSWHTKGAGALFIESDRADGSAGSSETILRCQEG